MEKFVLIVRHGQNGSKGGRNSPLSFQGLEQMQRVRQYLAAQVESVCGRPLSECKFAVFSLSDLTRAVESAQILAGENTIVRVCGTSLMERADLQWDFWIAELKRAVSLILEKMFEGDVSLAAIVGHSALPAILAETLRDEILQTTGVQLDTPEKGEGYLVSLDTGEVVPVRQADLT